MFFALTFPFVYFPGNLAHTKGKGINTMRSPRTPARTITFAKVHKPSLYYYCTIVLYIQQPAFISKFDSSIFPLELYFTLP